MTVRDPRIVSRMALTFAVAVAAGTGAGCLNRASVEPIPAPSSVERPEGYDHGLLDGLLRAHVDDAGLVDYPALRADSAQLARYLRGLAGTDPARLPEPDRLAFWLNAYNAYTLKLVLDSYPVASVLDAVKGPFIPTVNSPFSVAFATVGGSVRTLDDIEHGIIREQFDEPRIHFALVCAALSCPPLRAEAYTGNRLDVQLDHQARRFLRDGTKNQVTAARARLSKLFDWYGGDFGGSDEAVQRFIAPYFEGEVRARLADASLPVSFLDYDWSLNAQSTPTP